MGRLKSQGKSFEISKWEVWEAFRQVKANQGAAGVDGQSIADFEADLRNNLFKIWNRMSSGTYFPPAVRAVEIPKQHGGGMRMLGIPTVADRIAQTVVARHLGARVEPVFHEDSYGYRPGRSALDAAQACRDRCLRRGWVIDLDIQRFFDSVRHDLIVKAVEAHTDAPWALLYVRRWLMAPLQLPDGTLVQRDRGTPQGSALSPVLANLFMHYAFDAWLAREYPGVWFERYADDAVVHCVTERQAREVLAALGDRMEQVGLRLHPAKTKIVYCKDSVRRASYEHTSRHPHLTVKLNANQRQRLSRSGPNGHSNRAGRWLALNNLGLIHRVNGTGAAGRASPAVTAAQPVVERLLQQLVAGGVDPFLRVPSPPPVHDVRESGHVDLDGGQPGADVV